MHEFIAIDESDLIEAGIKAYEDETKEALYAGDERRFMINSFAYMILLAVREVNYGLNQQIPSTAEEDGLQILGEDSQAARLPSKKAIVSVRFFLAKEWNRSISIPYGTRVTYDGVHFFATNQSVIVQAADEYADIVCIATKAGSDGYNDIKIGQIATLVDNTEGVTSVRNTNVSYGGRDIEDIEAWRERISIKYRGINTAGSEYAYVYHIKSADALVGDVKLIDVQDSTVKFAVLCKDGSIPNGDLLEKIRDGVSKIDKRPLTDVFEVVAPNVVNYTVEFSYTIASSDMDKLELIVEQVRAAAKKFTDELGQHLGSDINPDRLRMYLFNAGASTVSVVSPAYTEVDDSSVAKLSGDIVITYAGMR